MRLWACGVQSRVCVRHAAEAIGLSLRGCSTRLRGCSTIRSLREYSTTLRECTSLCQRSRLSVHEAAELLLEEWHGLLVRYI